MKKRLKIKGKKQVKAVERAANSATNIMLQLENLPDDTEVAPVSVDALYNLCENFVILYAMLMEAKATPSPSQSKQFGATLH